MSEARCGISVERAAPDFATLIRVSCYAIQQAREVMNFVYHSAGATAIFESNPFERRFRDLHTVTQQGQGQYSNFESLGQTLMGRTATRQT